MWFPNFRMRLASAGSGFEPPSGPSQRGLWQQDADGYHSWRDLAEDGEPYRQDSMGFFWARSEWEDASATSGLSAEQRKEVEEAYSVAEAVLLVLTNIR